MSQLFDTDRPVGRYRILNLGAGIQSATIYCLMCEDPEAWARAVEVDEALRAEGSIANRDMHQIMYVHRSCVPLAKANLDEDQGELFGKADGCNEGCFL